MPMKVCRRCGVEKPEIDFPSYGGWICKKCKCDYANKYRQENIEKVREYDRNRPNKAERTRKFKEYLQRLKIEDHEKFADLTYRKANKFREQDEQKRKAWGKLNDAIRYGKIQKPSVCCLCGTVCNVEAHHEDYSKPLDVLWLCSKCHHVLHAKKREMIRKVRTGESNGKKKESL